MKFLALNLLPFEKKGRCDRPKTMKKLILLSILFVSVAGFSADETTTNPPWIEAQIDFARYDGYQQGLKEGQESCESYRRVPEDRSKWPTLRRSKKEQK